MTEMGDNSQLEIVVHLKVIVRLYLIPSSIVINNIMMLQYIPINTLEFLEKMANKVCKSLLLL